MNDMTHDQDQPASGIGQHTAGAENRRRDYASPTLKRHAKLPVITAGSISKEMWRFEDGDRDR